MPRLYRSLRRSGHSARRRHRTWMLSMTCATFAWGCWWIDLVMARFVPDVLPSVALVATVASLFAGVGLIAGFLCLRGRNRLWLAIACIPILANASLLATPFLLGDMKHFAEHRDGDAPSDEDAREPGVRGTGDRVRDEGAIEASAADEETVDGDAVDETGH